MTTICLYFQVHQPKRLKRYTYFDIGNSHFYEDEQANQEIFLKVANKCYLPTTHLLLSLIKKYPKTFKIAFSITGIFIEQCQKYKPELIEIFNQLVATEQVELLNETYYHSLSSVFSEQEFELQVRQHRQLIKDLFDYDAVTFRNTELIYNNWLSEKVAGLGYKNLLAEGADKILKWRSPNFLYTSATNSKVRLLLRNYRLTDDIAFRFSEKTWSEYPLHADKYAGWLHALDNHAELVNLFMDFETFGEHQWEDSGIFNFLEKFPEYVLQHPNYNFMTPREAAEHLKPVANIDIPEFISWADVDRDLTAWCGNELQQDALAAVYSLANQVYQTNNLELIATWKALLTSDHFYYMCTKYAADGDVHKYFSPYHNPYEAYINYQNVLSDLEQTIKLELATNQPKILPKIGDPLSKLGSQLSSTSPLTTKLA